jgi:hypothetical protein
VRDDFNVHTVRVREGQHLFFEPLAGMLDENALIVQPLRPIFERGGWNAESSFGDFTNARLPSMSMRPGKESENRPRRTGVVPEIEVVSARVIELTVRFTKRSPRTSV